MKFTFGTFIVGFQNKLNLIQFPEFSYSFYVGATDPHWPGRQNSSLFSLFSHWAAMAPKLFLQAQICWLKNILYMYNNLNNQFRCTEKCGKLCDFLVAWPLNFSVYYWWQLVTFLDLF